MLSVPVIILMTLFWKVLVFCISLSLSFFIIIIIIIKLSTFLSPVEFFSKLCVERE